MNRPKIVCLIGSSRFVDVMAVCAWFIERDEHAIALTLHLLPSWYSEEQIPGHLAEHEGCAAAMDELHLRKIDLSHEVFLVDANAYVGESTQRELDYTLEKGKPVRRFLTDPIGEAVRERIAEYIERLGQKQDLETLK